MYPALTVVAEIQKQATETRGRIAADLSDSFESGFLYVGRAGSIEERLARRAQITFEAIEVGGVRGYAPWTAARNLLQIYQSIGHVRALIRSFSPNVVFATGGYVSAPVIWAAKAEHIPSAIFLPDLEPGWAVRVTAMWATQIAVSFPEAGTYLPHNKIVVTGYPVRGEFFQGNRDKARKRFGFDPNVRTISIIGGSRGAHHINQAVVANLARLTQLAQIIHVTGPEDEAWVNTQVRELAKESQTRIQVYGYLDDDFPYALAAADLVVARAGAATLGELPALGLPAILIPYPYAGKHQERNSRFLVDHGAAVQVDDDGVERDLVLIIKQLFDAPEQLKKMSDAASALAQPQAAANIASLLRSLGKTE